MALNLDSNLITQSPEFTNDITKFLAEQAGKKAEVKAPAKPLDPKSKKGTTTSLPNDRKPGSKLKEEVLVEAEGEAGTDGVNLTHQQIVKALKSWIVSDKAFVKALDKASEKAEEDYPDDKEHQNREYSDALWALVKENLSKAISNKSLSTLLITLFRDIAKADDIASHLGTLKEEKNKEGKEVEK